MGAFDRIAVNKILDRDNHTCTYCGNPAWQVDHVIPVSQGGPAIKANGVAVCGHCNAKKRNRLDQITITRALYHLQEKGEDISWVDNFRFIKEGKANYYTEA